MSIHSDPRRNSLDEQEYAEWQSELRMEYAREEYDNKYSYEESGDCNYQGEDGSCNYDGNCTHQCGKWKEICGTWKESEEDDEESCD